MNVVRSSWGALLCLCLALGCTRTPTSADFVKQLSDPNPQVRDAAALSLRNMAARDPASVGDHGEAFWKAKLATVPYGITDDEVARALGTPGKTSNESGGPWSQTFQLDEYWRVRGSFLVDKSAGPETYRLSSWDPPERQARRVDVSSMPPGFSGKWRTYFIDGAVAEENDCVNGTAVRVAYYFDNGQVRWATDYVGGKDESLQITYFRDGKKESEGRYLAGKRVGPWVEYHPNGKPRVESTYVDGEQEGIVLRYRADGTKDSRTDLHLGKETGQASWDSSGKLQYERGSAREAPDVPPPIIPEARVAIARLSDPRQSERDAGARSIRNLLSADPGACGDPGEAYWKKKLATAKPGMTTAQFSAATGAKKVGTSFKLDDHWAASAVFDEGDKLREVQPPHRAVRAVSVEPSKGYSGKWVTYFIDGEKQPEQTYVDGKLVPPTPEK